jgi:hypothetical protein
MKEKVQAAAEGVGATIGATVPLVRRVAEDARTRAALRDMIGTGREVAGELRGRGGRELARGMFRNGRLSTELESGAQALHQVAHHMARAKVRARRRRTARLTLLAAGLGAAGLAVWKATTGSRRMTPQPPSSHPVAGGDWTGAPQAAATRPAGYPTPAAAGSGPAVSGDSPAGAG